MMFITCFGMGKEEEMQPEKETLRNIGNVLLFNLSDS